MNCHNGEKFLKKSILSITRQNYKNWELIFWDNQSQDNSKEIINFFKKDKRIKYFYSPYYKKLYQARNSAIKKAKGKYVCFLDTDDFWKKNFISSYINYINKYKCEILCGKFDVFDQRKGVKKINNFEKKTKILSTQHLLNNYMIGILAVMIRKKILKKYKFNNNFEIIGDFDLFLRLSKKFKINYINNSLATYRYHGENFSLTKINIYINEIKKWLLINSKNNKYNYNSIRLNLYKLQIKSLISKLFGRIVQW